MPNPDALEWNRRYESEPHLYAHREPRALLLQHLHLLPETGLALDAACGATPSGLFLAGRGWRVVGLDVAEAGLRRAQARARQEALGLSLAVMDLSQAWLPADSFDLILNFYFLLRPLWSVYKQALKPGGLLIFETFIWQDEEGSRRDFYLQSGELREAFADWKVLHYEESARRRSTPNLRMVAGMAARKPWNGE